MEIQIVFALGFRIKPFGIENPPPDLTDFSAKKDSLAHFAYASKVVRKD